jgi:RNA polymerase sigma-70 factor (ECF subfamily)
MAKNREKTAVPDLKLVCRAQCGEVESFHELELRHRETIYARAFSMMRNEKEAFVLSQEAWANGWQRIKQFQGESSFVTWMTRIVIDLCLDQLRQQKRPRDAAVGEVNPPPRGGRPSHGSRGATL